MTHPERVEDDLEHIAHAIEWASRYIGSLADVPALRQNEQVQDAVVRTLAIIGEAAARIQKIAPGFVAGHPAVPWVEMRGMPNKMIHEYFDVDWDIVWRTVKDDLPSLKGQTDELLVPYRRTETDRDRP